MKGSQLKQGGMAVHQSDQQQVEEALERLNTTDETQRLDAKTASEAGPAIYRTICAFSNSHGGEILCGVKKTAEAGSTLFGRYVVEGIEHPDKLITDVNSSLKSMLDPPIHVTALTATIGGANVVLFRIPP